MTVASIACTPSPFIHFDVYSPSLHRTLIANKMKVYFTDFFEIPPGTLEQYGAFNISLLSDLPLFIDPFLLFNSKKPKYQNLHDEIISYLRFLKDKSSNRLLEPGLLKALYAFPEIGQSWLGFTIRGNRGR